MSVDIKSEKPSFFSRTGLVRVEFMHYHHDGVRDHGALMSLAKQFQSGIAAILTGDSDEISPSDVEIRCVVRDHSSCLMTTNTELAITVYARETDERIRYFDWLLVAWRDLLTRRSEIMELEGAAYVRLDLRKRGIISIE